ncbi:hypothetical protein [Streptomyces sp. Rer75]|uniref:hypothetical protein n=1 Tax=unclassified Streptomyces TaxID=2593676 RepID=UPI0015D072E0|nr:hypothetical protein [Streptomyces sp. Rer75]QLH24478.1 hypothetical protein HYQ63_30745 [Streptomyces sp. Rer75]
MVGNHGELKVTKEAEERITRSLRSALHGLEGAGKGTGSARCDSLSTMSLSATEASGEGLSGTFSNFCEFWQLGINMLEQTANSLGTQLSQAAGVLWEEDRSRAGALRAGLGNAAVGAAVGPGGAGVSGILGNFGGPSDSGVSDYRTEPYTQTGPQSSLWDYVGTGGNGPGRHKGPGEAEGSGS